MRFFYTYAALVAILAFPQLWRHNAIFPDSNVLRWSRFQERQKRFLEEEFDNK